MEIFVIPSSNARVSTKLSLENLKSVVVVEKEVVVPDLEWNGETQFTLSEEFFAMEGLGWSAGLVGDVPMLFLVTKENEFIEPQFLKNTKSNVFISNWTALLVKDLETPNLFLKPFELEKPIDGVRAFAIVKDKPEEGQASDFFFGELISEEVAESEETLAEETTELLFSYPDTTIEEVSLETKEEDGEEQQENLTGLGEAGIF